MEEIPVPQVTDGTVLVKTSYSCVSAGTESAMIQLARKNALNKARERPDLAKQVIDKARNDGVISTYQAVKGRLEKPEPLGYSSAGRVIDVGSDVDGVQVGDTVACAGAGYASHAEFVSVPENLVAKVPEGAPLEDAAFTTVGSIAMQGIRRAGLTPGENVGVIGLGLVGQLCVGILDAYGFPTIGFDIQSRQVEKAKELGLTQGIALSSGDPEAEVDEFTNGNGLDAVIIAASTDSNDPVELAGNLARKQGTISVIGDVGMDVPRSTYYDKELDFNISRSYGPGRYDRSYEEKGFDYPIEYVRWTENRNMREFLRLLESESLYLDPIKTHEFEFDEAPAAYDMILDDSTSEYYSGILLKYSEDTDRTAKITYDITGKTSVESGTISTGLIGVGTFARSKLVPILADMDGVDIHAVASRTGKTAADVAQEHGAAYATSDPDDILEDPNIDFVVIATRHDTHASLAIRALNNDKNVHLEKPLCIDREDIPEIVKAEQNSAGRLVVGYNRRFAPQTREIRETFKDSSSPLVVNYRVAVDKLPDDHWVTDPEVGGGRIIGEVCHFVDFAQYVIGATPESVYADELSNSSTTEDVSVQIKFTEESIANIQYITVGDSSIPKEQIEIFGGNNHGEISNFRGGRLSLSQNKGHEPQFRQYVYNMKNGLESPIPIKDILYTSLSTFLIKDSILEGNRMNVDSELERLLAKE
ncbi:bi-domain-containing oxidoreductase [Halomontanus rarus]|uniref:bi-domain-containing oxidoreductase n=1 Tax=Halomontanus rarus TaxID=3034020 RepID=UPI0023E8B08F|nr:bi-domain-containing oxidoreductase [Halovivax sp. TS33]